MARRRPRRWRAASFSGPSPDFANASSHLLTTATSSFASIVLPLWCGAVMWGLQNPVANLNPEVFLFQPATQDLLLGDVLGPAYGQPHLLSHLPAGQPAFRDNLQPVRGEVGFEGFDPAHGFVSFRIADIFRLIAQDFSGNQIGDTAKMIGVATTSNTTPAV